MKSSTHTDISNVFSIINDELRQVKDFISSSVFRDMPAAMRKAIYPLRDSLFSGKMLRPALVILSYRALKDGLYKKTAGYEVIRVSAVVEMIHNATLLHDDVIDEGLKRRGVPTINSLLGNEFAVLLGDFLLSKVFQLCTELDSRLVGILADSAAKTCEGELRQIIERQNWQLSEAEYIDIITSKSAALFGGCCGIGGLLAQADEAMIKSLRHFGLNLGIAFQITDDLLDIIGDESEAGKTLGSDADKDKLTLAQIHLLRSVREDEKSKLIEKLSNSFGDKHALSGRLKNSGHLEYAHSLAQKFIEKAIGQLESLKDSTAKEALIETARYVGGRACV
jgi:octaprenyl-diphosphate synthase